MPIILPAEITAKLPISATGDARNKIIESVRVDIEEYGREVALVGIILSDNFMKSLYKAQGTGYIAALDTLAEWAKECVDKYAHVEEWEEFMDSDENPYKAAGAMCWDDYVIHFGYEKMGDNNFIVL